MFAVGGPAGDADGPERDGGGHQIEPRMKGLGEDAQAVGPEADAEFRAGQQEGRRQRRHGHPAFFAVGQRERFLELRVRHCLRHPCVPFFFGGAAAVIMGNEFPKVVAASLGIVSSRQARPTAARRGTPQGLVQRLDAGGKRSGSRTRPGTGDDGRDWGFGIDGRRWCGDHRPLADCRLPTADCRLPLACKSRQPDVGVQEVPAVPAARTNRRRCERTIAPRPRRVGRR